MRRYSPEWFTEVEQAVSTISTAPTAAATFGQIIRRDDGSVAEFHFRVDDGSCRIVVEDPGSADVAFEADEATAAAVAEGRESARDAFLDGRMVLRGDADVLVEHAELIASIGRAISVIVVDP